jgi:hypothetical protein
VKFMPPANFAKSHFVILTFLTELFSQNILCHHYNLFT